MTTATGVPFVALFASTSLPGGRCSCTACVNDAHRVDAERDKALAEVVYELGREVLRQRALGRVPAFVDAFRTVA